MGPVTVTIFLLAVIIGFMIVNLVRIWSMPRIIKPIVIAILYVLVLVLLFWFLLHVMTMQTSFHKRELLPMVKVAIRCFWPMFYFRLVSKVPLGQGALCPSLYKQELEGTKACLRFLCCKGLRGLVSGKS